MVRLQSTYDLAHLNADKMLDAALAEAELNEGIHETDNLAGKYTSGGNISVDEELQHMKAELGL